LSLVVFSLNAVTDTSGRSSSLMVFGKVPRPLASIPSDGHEWEQLKTRDRHSLQIFAREAAELATAKTRLHEINRHARPTDVAPYVPGELCYAFREKDGSRDDKPGFTDPFVVLWRDGTTCRILSGKRPRPFPTSHVKSASAADKRPLQDAIEGGVEMESQPLLRRSPRLNPQVDNLASAYVDIHFLQFWTQTCDPGTGATLADSFEIVDDANDTGRSNCTGKESGEPAASRDDDGDIDSTVFANTAPGNSRPPRFPGNIYGERESPSDDGNSRYYVYSTSDIPAGARDYLKQKVILYNAELQEELPGVEVYVRKIVTRSPRITTPRKHRKRSKRNSCVCCRRSPSSLYSKIRSRMLPTLSASAIFSHSRTMGRLMRLGKLA
jgi:hypothetical protein